ncbi:hypothetical protein GCM10027094_42590 [Hafnia psychrotolerans]
MRPRKNIGSAEGWKILDDMSSTLAEESTFPNLQLKFLANYFYI